MKKQRLSFLLLFTVLSSGAFAQTGLVVRPVQSDSKPYDKKTVVPRPPTSDVPPNEIPKGRGNTFIYVGAGYNFLSKTTKSSAFLNDAIGVNLSVYQPFVSRKLFTFGLQAGFDYGFSTKDNLPTLPNAFHVVGETSSTVAFQTSTNGIKQSAFKFDLGPQLNIHAGNHFSVGAAFTVGAMVFTQPEFSAVQTTLLSGATSNYTLLRKWNVTSGGVVLTPKLRLHYFINDWVGLWAEVNYTFLPSIKSTISKFTPQDTPDSSGFYDIFQLDNGKTTTEQTVTKYSAVGVNGGLVFSFGRKKEKVPHDLTSEEPTYRFTDKVTNVREKKHETNDEEPVQEDKKTKTVASPDDNITIKPFDPKAEEEIIEVMRPTTVSLTDTTLPDQACEYCKYIKLLSPNENQQLHVKKNSIINFSWTDVKSRVYKKYGYKLSIYQVSGKGDALVFETLTDKNTFDFKTDELKELGDAPKAFTWRIALIDKTTNAVCPQQHFGNFKSMTANNNHIDITVDTLIIKCKQPNAFNTNGNVDYDIEFRVTDRNSMCNNVAVNPVLEQNPDHPDGYTLYIPGIANSVPITFNSGFGLHPSLTHNGTYLANGSFSVPANTPTLTTAQIDVFYNYLCPTPLDNGNIESGSDYNTAKLPDCTCNICKNWTLGIDQAVSATFKVHKNTSTIGYDVLEFNGKLTASPGPITEVKVELVAFSFYFNNGSTLDESCKPLNDVSSLSHGTILTSSGTFVNRLGLIADFQPGGLTSNLANTGRQIKWVSNVPTGVNMSASKNLQLFIGIPDYISNSCCKPVYNFCLRVSYRDADCRVCEKLKCFTVGPGTSIQYVVTN